MRSNSRVSEKIVLAVFVFVFLANIPTIFATRVAFYQDNFDVALAGWTGDVGTNQWGLSTTAGRCTGAGGLYNDGATFAAGDHANKTNINNTTIGTRGWQNIEVNFTNSMLALDSGEYFEVFYTVNGTGNNSAPSGRTLLQNFSAANGNGDDFICVNRAYSLPTNASDTDYFSLTFICQSSSAAENCTVDNLNVSGIPARFSWNESTAATSIAQGGNITRQARVTFSGNNTGVTISQVAGNGTGFMVTNMSTVPAANALETKTLDVDFYCAPSGGQAAGIYFTQYNITSAQNNSSVNFAASAGEGVFLNCTVSSSTVSLNETTITARNMYGGTNVTREVKVSASSGTISFVNVTNATGNGTAITTLNNTFMQNMSTTGKDLSAYCTPSISQAPGVYEATYKINASSDGTGQNLLVKCPVLNSNMSFNETSPSTSVAQGASINREVKVLFTGLNNWTNITNASDGSGNGSAFMSKNTTEIGNMTNGSTYDVKFTCAPGLAQVLGVYDYNVSVNSTQNTTTVNLTVKCTVTTAQDTTISMVKSTVSFENMAISETNNTDDDNPPPFVIRNDGNVNVNITIAATDLFSSTANPTTNYQWNSTANESGSLQNNVLGQNLFGYTNTPASGSPTKCIGELKSADANDQATVNINLTIPSVETGGNKTSTVTFIASAA